MSNIFHYILAAILAFMPAIIWLDIFKHHLLTKQKWIAGWLFLAGMLSALPLLALLYIWYWYNDIDFYDQVAGSISNVYLSSAIVAILVGIFEEILKNSVVRYSDKFNAPIRTIGDGVKFSLFAALGFAFTENILYFANTIGVNNFIDTFVVIVFRSIFTICAHLVFSGIMGYYLGIFKFAQPFIEEEKWEGRKYWIAEILNRLFKIKKVTGYSTIKISQGLILAAGLHALFNLLLQYRQLQYATLLVVAGFIFIYYLMTRKFGHLMLAYEKKRQSLMADKDEDVIIELLGIWLKEGKYAEVESIAKRLLEKDPDNKIVKIFLAKSHDRKKLENAYLAIKALFSPEDAEKVGNILEKPKESTSEK